jgi:hypothetical protein
MTTRGDELRAYLFAKRLDKLGSCLPRTRYRDLDAAGAVTREPGVGGVVAEVQCDLVRDDTIPTGPQAHPRICAVFNSGPFLADRRRSATLPTALSDSTVTVTNPAHASPPGITRALGSDRVQVRCSEEMTRI